MQIQNLCIHRDTQVHSRWRASVPGAVQATPSPPHPHLPPLHTLQKILGSGSVFAPTLSTDLHTHTGDAPLACLHGGCPPLPLPPRHPSNLHSLPLLLTPSGNPTPTTLQPSWALETNDPTTLINNPSEVFTSLFI